MALNVTAVNIAAVQDVRFTPGNAQFARKLDIGNNFVRIRIGLRLAIDDTGANIPGTPRLWLGLLSNPVGVPITNGPLSASTSHFVGGRTNFATWTRATSGIVYYDSTSGGSQLIKRVGSTDTTAVATGKPTRLISAAPSSVRFACIMDITKGSPNFSINNVAVANTTGFATGDLSMGELITAMEIPTLAGVVTSLNTATGMVYSEQGATTIAVSEGTDGILNAICLAWDRSTPLIYASEMFYCTFAT